VSLTSSVLCAIIIIKVRFNNPICYLWNFRKGCPARKNAKIPLVGKVNNYQLELNFNARLTHESEISSGQSGHVFS
jgi:hypothetical protein